MAYATLYHVEAKNSARGQFDANTKPNATQVIQFLNEAAGIIDNALAMGGYSPPIAMGTSSVPSSVQAILQKINAEGAAYMVEASAQSSQRRDEFQQMWESGLKMLKAGELPGMTEGAGQGLPRSASSSAATPIFSLDMEL